MHHHFRRNGALLDDAAVGGDVAPEDLQAAGRGIRILDGTDGLVVQDMSTLDVLTDCLLYTSPSPRD